MSINSKFVFMIIFLTGMVLLPGAGGTAYAQSAVKGKPVPHQLYSPMRIAFGPDGNLLVSDYRTHMIAIIDPDSNQAIRFFEVKGHPMGVAYSKGHIYVGNVTKKRIEVFNMAGKKFKKPVFNTVVKNPTDIAIDPKTDDIFVVDGTEKVVLVFNPRGKLTGTIPASGPDPEVLTAPTAIAVDKDRKQVLISDYGDPGASIDPSIRVFSYKGDYQGKITNVAELSTAKMGMGGWGFKTPRFSRPQGLVVTEAGYIFLVDCFAGEVIVLNRESGDHVKTIGTYGSDPGEMRLPLDLVIDKRSGDIFVTNNRLARIEIFRKGGIVQ
jgi:DNA-binding beta-propeller fold protein YncE